MNLLIDLSPLKSGGGVQLATNFLELLKTNHPDYNISSVFILLPDCGTLTSYKDDNKYLSIIAPSKIYKRIYFEYFTLRSIIKEKQIDTVFTFFGTGLPNNKRVKSIVCVAYPIICYNDSSFWKYLTLKQKYLQKIKNYFRVKRIRTADLILVETDVMRNRLIDVLNCNDKKIQVLPPSPSEYVKNTVECKNNISKLLFLSGNSPHKNLWRLPAVAAHLKDQNISIKFLISVSKDEYVSSLANPKDLINVQEYFEFIGPIHPKDIGYYYNIADCLVLLSDLESFSNNYMEAWKAGIPIIASNRDFARMICRDSAVYVEPHDPRSVVNGIKEIINNTVLCGKLVDNGFQYLEELPSQKKRMDYIFQYIHDTLNEKKD